MRLAFLLFLGIVSTACSRKMATGPLFSYVGEFRSVAGVMDPLSCYCFNGGYLLTSEGNEIAICLTDQMTLPECTSVRVTGSFNVQQRSSGPMDPCPAGERRILKATRIGCR